MFQFIFHSQESFGFCFLHPLELALELTGTPMQLGIAWRDNDAEPKTVYLARVAPGLLRLLR